jgi:hypothetical protein
MKAMNVLLIALAVLLLAAAGVSLMALAWMPGFDAGLGQAYLIFSRALGTDDNLRWGLTLLGALLLAGSWLAIWVNLSTRRWERTVVFHNPLGEVMVSLTALEDIGRQAKQELPGVKDLKLRVLPRRRGGLQAIARVVLFNDVNLPATTEAIQETIRRRLIEVVGEGQDIRPRVMVSKVAFRSPGDEEVPVYRPYGRARRPPRP